MIPPLDPPAHAVRRQPDLKGLPVEEGTVDGRRWCRDHPAGVVCPTHGPILGLRFRRPILIDQPAEETAQEPGTANKSHDTPIHRS